MSNKMTITEALSELKLIEKKIDSINKFIMPRLTHPVTVGDMVWVDPHEAEGGVQAVIAQKIQAVHDLAIRAMNIRVRINAANLVNEITIAGTTRSIAEWLAWRRETLPYLKLLYTSIAHNIVAANNMGTTDLMRRRVEGVQNMIAHVDSGHVQDQIETLIEIDERLDGALSLANATILIEVSS